MYEIILCPYTSRWLKLSSTIGIEIVTALILGDHLRLHQIKDDLRKPVYSALMRLLGDGDLAVQVRNSDCIKLDFSKLIITGLISMFSHVSIFGSLLHMFQTKRSGLLDANYSLCWCSWQSATHCKA